VADTPGLHRRPQRFTYESLLIQRIPLTHREFRRTACRCCRARATRRFQAAVILKIPGALPWSKAQIEPFLAVGTRDEVSRDELVKRAGY